MGGRLDSTTSQVLPPLKLLHSGLSRSRTPQLARTYPEVPCGVPSPAAGWTLPCYPTHCSISNLHAIKFSGHRKSARKGSSVISKDGLHCLAFRIALPKWAFSNWASRFCFYSLFVYYATIRINYAASSWREIRFGCKLGEERKRCTSQRKRIVPDSPKSAGVLPCTDRFQMAIPSRASHREGGSRYVCEMNMPTNKTLKANKLLAPFFLYNSILSCNSHKPVHLLSWMVIKYENTLISDFSFFEIMSPREKRVLLLLCGCVRVSFLISEGEKIY